MPSGLFTFLQVELPFELGPPDGRWLFRGDARDVERVLALRTVGSLRADATGSSDRLRKEAPRPGQRHGQRSAGRVRRTPRADPPETDPATVPIARATVIDPATLPDEKAADAWLGGLDPEQAIDEAFAWLNRFLQAHRIAAADAYAKALHPMDALALRAGYGEGEQVAEGRWLRAVPLVSPRLRRRARRHARMREARAEGHFAALLGGRVKPLLCEELTLRARLDLDLGRLPHAAIDLERAYAAALVELTQEAGIDLSTRLAELRRLQPEVQQAASAALPPGGALPVGAPLREDTLRHALTRLEAALRARALASLWTA